MNELIEIDEENIKNKIFSIRGLSVMLDRDLAELYEVESKRLNEQVKRNIERFPENFRFQLTQEEYQNLRSQFATLSSNNSLRSQIATLESKRGKYSKYLPYVFTEQGVSMLSAVLKSKVAIEISIKIINSFVNMRKTISNNTFVSKRLETLEHKQFLNDEKFNKLFDALEDKSLKPKQGIFYDGQVFQGNFFTKVKTAFASFDAYVFVSNLIKSAKSSIVLIDNYVDESVLTMLSKRNVSVSVTIYTKNINKQLQLDIKKYNAQYPSIILKKLDASHDRFLILDDKEVYHIGASLKDLDKKWFFLILAGLHAFSRFDIGSFDILDKLEKNLK